MEERGKHLGAAASFELLYETACGSQVFRVAFVFKGNSE